jgi:2-keto-3-deoxy-L-rhamnonate aldolase RhmA
MRKNKLKQIWQNGGAAINGWLTMGSSQTVDLTEPDLVAVLDTILAAAQRHNLVAGIFCSAPHYAQKMIELGWQFVNVSSDSRLLSAAAAQSVAQTRVADR